MRYRHADKKLELIDENPGERGGYGENLVKVFRKRMQVIRAATNEADLRQFKSYRFEKLKGDRQHQRSIRLNDQFRLIVEIEPQPEGNVIIIIAIEDYH